MLADVASRMEPLRLDPVGLRVDDFLLVAPSCDDLAELIVSKMSVSRRGKGLAICCMAEESSSLEKETPTQLTADSTLAVFDFCRRRQNTSMIWRGGGGGGFVSEKYDVGIICVIIILPYREIPRLFGWLGGPVPASLTIKAGVGALK